MITNKQTAIYIRTSTEEQNPQNQLKDCLSINNNEPYLLFEEMESAFKDINRAVFENLRKEIAKGNILKLICWDLDRLFRNRNKLIEFFKFCKVYNCKILSFRQQWLNQFETMPKPFDEITFDLMLSIMGWLSEEESKKKSDRVKIAFQNHKGNKWGRVGVDDKVKDKLIQFYKDNPSYSLRKISDDFYYYDENRNKKKVSKSFVHKTIKELSV